MKTGFACCVLVAVAVRRGAAPADKPRVFIVESQALQVSADANIPDGKGFVELKGGNSPQNVEVMKVFMRRCPGVAVTSNRKKADYVIRLDHEGTNPTTPFVKENKVAIFNKDEDLVFSDSTRPLRNAAKDACAAVTSGWRN